VRYLKIVHPFFIPFRVRALLDFDYLTLLYWPNKTTEVVYDPDRPNIVELRSWLDAWDRHKFHRDAYVALLAALASALFVLYVFDAVRTQPA
jgi:hypothetical protein